MKQLAKSKEAFKEKLVMSMVKNEDFAMWNGARKQTR